jgi:hypothetical protein
MKNAYRIPMKTITLFLSLLFVGLGAFSPARAQANLYTFAKSPDHPSTWVDGASNIRQGLRWDDSRQMLVADVTYSTRDYADGVHPAHEGEYTLSFPSVHLDKESRTFVAGGTRVGMLAHGIFGDEVVLDSKAELDIHWHHGRIFAAINPATE